MGANDLTQNHYGGTMATSTFPVSLLTSKQIPSTAYPPPGAYNSSNRADLVRSAQDGDQDAFSELYAQHKKQVFSICIRMVHSFPLAEDLTQETFLQVHRKLASFRGESVFSTWLHRTAVNIVLMHLRKRALNAVSLDHLMASSPDERTGRSFGKRDLTQAGVIDRLAINQVIDTMAPGYRSIFILHDVHGFDHGEIASMLNCSSGNTKSQLHKARKVLRSALSAKADSVLHMSSRRREGPPTLPCTLPCGRRQSTELPASPIPSR
jgi:RNA polymerase sigma-70 factor (ECF subfamily)